MIKKRIHSVLDGSFLDFPGEVPLTVFFSGCNLRCEYCSNASVVVDPPKMTLGQVLDLIKGDATEFYTGVCLLGGEPLIQPVDVLIEFCGNLKELGLKVKVDSNGTFFNKLEALYPYVDYIAIDVKHLWSKYNLVTPVTQDQVRNIQESVTYVRLGPKPYRLRTTVCSPIHTVDDLYELKRQFPELMFQEYSSQGPQLFKRRTLSLINLPTDLRQHTIKV